MKTKAYRTVIYQFILMVILWLSVFNEMTKRNDKTKSRNEMTKSVNDDTGFGVVGIVLLYNFLYFTKCAAGWIQNGTRLSYMFAAIVFPI